MAIQETRPQPAVMVLLWASKTRSHRIALLFLHTGLVQVLLGYSLGKAPIVVFLVVNRAQEARQGSA